MKKRPIKEPLTVGRKKRPAKSRPTERDLFFALLVNLLKAVAAAAELLKTLL